MTASVMLFFFVWDGAFAAGARAPAAGDESFATD